MTWSDRRIAILLAAAGAVVYLVAGIGLHLGIEALMKIPMFTAVMLVSYIVLLDDSEIRWLLRLGQVDEEAREDLLQPLRVLAVAHEAV